MRAIADWAIADWRLPDKSKVNSPRSKVRSLVRFRRHLVNGSWTLDLGL